MNMHVPQSVTTSTEIEILAGVTPTSRRPANTSHHHRRPGRRARHLLITQQPDVRIDRKAFNRSPTSPPTTACRFPLADGATHYTGAQALSLPLPPTLHIDNGKTIVGRRLEKGSIDRAVPEAVHGRPA
jgi:hypothetical protein